jgi:lysozyme
MIWKQKLKDLLKLHEGFKSSVYQDTEGYWTIGIGRMVDPELGGGISLDEAEYLLENDINRCQTILENNLSFWNNLSECRQVVLLDMYFNLGNRLFKFKKMMQALYEEDYNKASDEMLDSKWSKQVGERSERLARMMKEDAYAEES